MDLDKTLNTLDLNEPSSYNSDDYGFLSFTLPKETIKVIEELKRKENIQEQLIRRLIKNKFFVIEEELQISHELIIKYEAMCIAAKDQSLGISDKYDQLLEDISNKLSEKSMELEDKLLNPYKKYLDSMTNMIAKVEKQADVLYDKLDKIQSKLALIPNTYTLKDITRVIESWESMGKEAKEILSKVLVAEKVTNKNS